MIGLSRRLLLGGSLILLSLSIVAAWGLVPRQSTRIYRVGHLAPTTPAALAASIEVFRQELRNLGYDEGRNLVIDERFSQGSQEELAEVVRELLALNADVIVTAGPGVRAAARVTQTTPVVFWAVTDPVGTGLITSLARPGGNLTGVTNVSEEIDGKRLELLKEAFPGLHRVAFFWDPATPPSPMEATARALGLELQTYPVRSADDLEQAFQLVRSQAAEGLVTGASPVFLSHRSRIVEFAAGSRLPAIYTSGSFVEIGGLMNYTRDSLENWRRAATFVDKILRGASPADLPVEQPTTFEFRVNLRTAQTLGLTIPPSVLAQATEVIQ